MRLLDRIGSGHVDGIERLIGDLNRCRTELRPGTLLTREWDGQLQRVMVLSDGFSWNGTHLPQSVQGRLRDNRRALEWSKVFWPARSSARGGPIVKNGRTKSVHCAIYTRVSTDHGLEQDFNSLDAQYDASQAYIRSQAHAGWTLMRARYDDGGFSGGNTERPALQRLLEDVRAGKVDVIVVYKVDRLTRSLADFAKLVELFDSMGCRSSRSPSSSIRPPRWGD